MYQGKRILGVIPARGGSKGLPGKNIRPLLGKPLLAWTLEEARASQYLDRVIVSTDSEEIAAVARQYHGDVPFLRPPEIALDATPTFDVLEHVVAELKKGGETYDFLILLEPTSPLRETSDIDRGVERLLSHKTAKALVSVARLEGAHPEFHVVIDPATGCFRRPGGGSDFKILRRQDLTDMYYLEGTLYISDLPTLLERKTFYHADTLPYIVPRWKSPEIDELEDIIMIEALLKARQEGQL